MFYCINFESMYDFEMKKIKRNIVKKINEYRIRIDFLHKITYNSINQKGEDIEYEAERYSSCRNGDR